MEISKQTIQGHNVSDLQSSQIRELFGVTLQVILQAGTLFFFLQSLHCIFLIFYLFIYLFLLVGG